MAVQLDVVVGIQIGTHYNSLVCFFPYDETRYPSPTWDDPSTGKVQSKQRTIAVYSHNKVFQAFGHEAVKQIQGQNNTNLLVLSNFVNDIFCSGIQVPKKVRAENGVMVSSFDLTSSVISCLIRNPNLRKIEPLKKRYVFTIPSRACEKHAEFLESAAKNAGLHKGQILVIPKAAAILHFCKHKHRAHADGKEIDPFIIGKPNVVLECEVEDNTKGFTVRDNSHTVYDVGISILMLQEDDAIEIIYNSFENEIILSKVQHNFEDLISQIVGKSVFDDFCQRNISDYHELLHTLHDKIKGPSTEIITFSLPAELFALIEEQPKERIEKAIEKMNLVNKVYFFAGKCRIAPDVFQTLFMDTKKNVVQLLHKVLVDSGLKEKVNIILPGEFSNSVIFQDTIRREFPDDCIITDEEEIATKGAALYGHRPVKLILKERLWNTAQVAVSVQRRKKRRRKHLCSVM